MFDKFELIYDVTGNAQFVAPIYKSIWRAIKRSQLDYVGFTEPARFNPKRSYELLIKRYENGVYEIAVLSLGDEICFNMIQ